MDTGIAGFLAESALTSHLFALTIKESKDSSVEEVCELPVTEDLTGTHSAQLAGEDSHAESLKGSLSAFRKSTQAAARLFQAFRVESFHRKKVVEYGDDDCGLCDDARLHWFLLKMSNQDNMIHICILLLFVSKTSSEDGREKKEFMIIRQRIVKIQARVRGYQLRKNYRKVVWSVGIVEKVILRWRERPDLRVPGKLLVGPSKINLQRQKMNTISCRMAEGRLKPDYREHLPGCIVWLNIQKQENNTIDLQLVLLKCSSPGVMQDEMLSEAAVADGNDFMTGLNDLICRDDAQMSAIW